MNDFVKKLNERTVTLFLEMSVNPSSFMHGLRIRAKYESQFKQLSY